MSFSPTSELLHGRIPENTKDAEEFCIFRFGSGITVGESLLSLKTEDGGIFSLPNASVLSLFSRTTLRFLVEELKEPHSHYVLLLTKSNHPILAVTAAFRYGGICPLFALKATPSETLAFLKTMPNIRYVISPTFDGFSPQKMVDPAVFARLSLTFRRLFSIFESVYAVPAEYVDPIRLFRLMQMKLRYVADLFGMEADFLLQHTFQEPMRENISVDLDLFSATALLLVAAARQYSAENRIRIVFMALDRCPAICLHFRVDSAQYEESQLQTLLKTIYQRRASFFDTCMGEHARKEAEKIPGVGHMILNDRYAALGDHTLNVFVPIKRDWTGYTLRCPIFRLPDSFFDNFHI